ncbi:sensor histidine kinase [Faunimonas pinastri]|nr:HAMP domain-containing sensor histidine kinase [Faunimonas pinastri]
MPLQSRFERTAFQGSYASGVTWLTDGLTGETRPDLARALRLSGLAALLALPLSLIASASFEAPAAGACLIGCFYLLPSVRKAGQASAGWLVAMAVPALLVAWALASMAITHGPVPVRLAMTAMALLLAALPTLLLHVGQAPVRAASSGAESLKTAASQEESKGVDRSFSSFTHQVAPDVVPPDLEIRSIQDPAVTLRIEAVTSLPAIAARLDTGASDIAQSSADDAAPATPEREEEAPGNAPGDRDEQGRCNVNEQVDFAFRLLAHEAASRNVRLVQQAEEQVDAGCDERVCRQILLNLVGNAIKFGGRDSTVNVLVRRMKGTVLVQVVDEGPGLSNEDCATVLVPYYRGATDEPGTGLGLSIVNDLVEECGGSIVLKNGADKGLVVSIRLPLV